VTNLSIVVLLLVLIVTNLSSDFNDFVSQAETKHLKVSKQQLITLYQQQNSWQAIINNVQIWRDIVDPQPNRRPPPPPPSHSPLNYPPQQDFRARENRPPPPPKENNSSDFFKTGRRLSLYDANKNVIVGKQFLSENPRTEAIIIDGTTIGWLGLMPSNVVKDSPANEFLTKQYKTYYYVGAAAITIAFFMALLLSNHLLAPIKQLIMGTNKLIQGNYQKRIIKTTNDELGTLSDNFNDLAHTLEKNQQNRFQWMSDTSHELRTPLTVLKSQLMAIQDGIFTADKNRIELFIDEVDNLNLIVDDLYQLSSSDAGALTYKKSQLNPVLLLKQVIESYQSKFSQKSLSSDYSCLDSLQCNMLADKDRLKQLFSNLLENSYRYTDTGGQITIYAIIKNSMLELQIQDSYPGVNKNIQHKLFERFYRVEKSRNRSHGGSGLGLAICKQIVEAHQGNIVAMDSTLGGLNIKITFPIQ